MTNVHVARFENSRISSCSEVLYQYDYGQLLQFEGIDLPAAYEVHFSKTLNGTATTVIGDSNGVSIPDSMLESAGVLYAWVFLHSGEDDGETQYVVTMVVRARAGIDYEAPTEDERSAIAQAIAALNHAVEQTTQAVLDANQAKADAVDAQGKAEEAQGAAENAKTAAVQAIEAKGEQVLKSIPSDYTELSGDVEGLKSASGGGGRPTIYCWGDSLTEGVGGWVMQPDGHNAYMAFSYPAWVGQSYDVVNLGVRSEDLSAIMARQGDDPIVIKESFTIPASQSTPVKILTVTQLYDNSGGVGFTTKSGATVKINKEVESAGLNPCVIAGVEGIIYRQIGSSYLSNDASYDYYFKRLEDGSEVNVPVDTEVETYAMRFMRNGVGIFWVGANGGFSSVTDYVRKINAMIEYGRYDDYLVIISREMSGSNLETVKAEFTDSSGFCHVIDLMQELPYRGYAMAGIPYQSVDTSGWSTIDPVKKNAPLLCEYLSGQSGENQYGALHYSAWGYKAIGKLVVEKLGRMNLVVTSSGGSGGSGSQTTTDNYGTLLYKLAARRTLKGTDYINTRMKLYEDVTADWTFAIKWSGEISSTEGLPYNIFCCCKDGDWKGLLYRYYAEWSTNVLFGNAVFVGPDSSTNCLDNHGGINVVVISKSGNNYMAFINSSNKLYNATLTYTLTSEDAHDLPLIIGGRYNAEGDNVFFKTAFTVEDVRIYNSALDEASCIDLYNELAGL